MLKGAARRIGPLPPRLREGAHYFQEGAKLKWGGGLVNDTTSGPTWQNLKLPYFQEGSISMFLGGAWFFQLFFFTKQAINGTWINLIAMLPTANMDYCSSNPDEFINIWTAFNLSSSQNVLLQHTCCFPSYWIDENDCILSKQIRCILNLPNF